MSIGNAATFVAAALLASTTTFAQAPAPERTTSTRAQNESPATQVTLIGCVQRESDYRREHNIRRGGGLNTGLGSGDEFMLINASRVTPGSAPASGSADCASAGSGEAFEITGPREEQFKALVGKRVEVTGMQKRARVAASGKPTGGTDPLGGDLGLFEVEVSSVKESGAVAQAQRTETQRVESQPPAAAPAPAPEPERAPAPAAAATPRPAPTGTAGATQSEQREARQRETTLPKTASPLPLYGLLSMLLFGGAYGVRRLRTK